MVRQRVGIACLLSFVLAGAAVPLTGVRAQEEIAEVLPKAGIEGRNVETGETYRGDILSEAQKDAFLNAHNAARDEVGLEPLAWSDDIARYSLSWIIENHQSYLEAARGQKLPILKHRPRGDVPFRQKYGENLASWSGPESTNIDPSRAVSLWLREKPDFDKLNALQTYVVGDEAGKTDDKGVPIMVGHYTQIVWTNTTHIGAAMFSVNLKGKSIVVLVCNYAPPGNRLGKSPF